MGLEPVVPTQDLPNYILPKMDGIGANEYIVTVTSGLVDFYSAGDTPAPWELNMWYHTLNCGFRTRISGETDFPCIYDERVGVARSYFKPAGILNYKNYIDALKNGRCYVSEGSSHIIDFKVNDLEMGTHNSELLLKQAENVHITAKIACYLPPEQGRNAQEIASRPLTKSPYWHVERARIPGTRNVRVELIVNGKAVDTTVVAADGKWKDIRFNYALKTSSWIALRVLSSSHTNPIFVLLNNKPVLVTK